VKQNLLTARRVEEIMKSDEFKVYPDGMGLMLVGSPEYRTFSWKQRLYTGTVTGKARDIGLGSAREVSLKQARTKGRALRELARDGIDPVEQRRQRKAVARAEAAARVLFGQATEEFLSLYGPTWKNDKHRQQWRSTLAMYAGGLRSVPVAEIDAATVNEILMPVFARAPETASRVRERILRICKWIADGRPPPLAGGNGTAKHHAALPYAEIPTFMPKLRERHGNSARCLEFCILTAARAGEALGARWDELDLDEKVWILPPARMKSGREHVVPLSDRVLAVLASMPRSEALIFPSTRGGPMNGIAMLQMLKKIDSGLTVHGFRSSFRDWAGDSTNTPKDVIEHALAHAVKNKVERAYRRGSAIEKRRKLMELWARFCSMPASGGKVVRLHG
jgi:integrase